VKTSYQCLLWSKIILFDFQDLTSDEVIDSPNSEVDSSANYDDNKSVLYAVNYVGKGKEQPFPVQWLCMFALNIKVGLGTQFYKEEFSRY